MTIADLWVLDHAGKNILLYRLLPPLLIISFTIKITEDLEYELPPK